MTPHCENRRGLAHLLCGILLCAVCGILPAAGAAQEIEAPAWFKNSFLDLRDDLKEPDFQRFIQARSDAIRERGGRVDLMQ